MIARTWRGSVRAGDAERYVDYLRETGFAGLGSTPGNLAVVGLRRADGDHAEFVVLSLWESMDAVRRFAGERAERAVFYPGDDGFLVEREEHVSHFDVVHLSGPAGNAAGDEPAGGLLHRLAGWWLRRGVTSGRARIRQDGRLPPHGFTYVRLP